MVDPVAAFQRCATLADAIVVGLAQRPELMVIEVVADELLAARVASGWQPTATATVDGPVIMGHACKLVAR